MEAGERYGEYTGDAREGGESTQKQDVKTLKTLKALHFPGLHESHYFSPHRLSVKGEYHCVSHQSAEQYKDIPAAVRGKLKCLAAQRNPLI